MVQVLYMNTASDSDVTLLVYLILTSPVLYPDRHIAQFSVPESVLPNPESTLAERAGLRLR